MPYAMDIEQRDRALMFVMLRLSSVSHFKHGFFRSATILRSYL